MMQDKMKQQIYNAMPAEPITTEALAHQLRTTPGKLTFYLKLLKYEQKVDYLGRVWNRRFRTNRGTWRRKP